MCLQVMPFFNRLGFACPEAKGDADFLQDVTIQKGQAQFRKDKSRKHDYMTVKVCAKCFDMTAKVLAEHTSIVGASPLSVFTAATSNDLVQQPNTQGFSGQ